MLFDVVLRYHVS